MITSRWVFLEWEMFQRKVVVKIVTNILCPITLFRRSCRLWDNVEKYCTAGQATDDNVIGRMPVECWIPTATNTHSEYVTFSFYTATMANDSASILTSLPTLPPMFMLSWTSLYIIHDQEQNIHNLLMLAALAANFVPSHLLKYIN